MIEDIRVTPLRIIRDERGKVMQMLKSSSVNYKHFGELYYSCINPGYVKAWKLHKRMLMNCATIHGQIKFVIYDARFWSASYGKVFEILMGDDNYVLLTIPPLLWIGFSSVGKEAAVLANFSSIEHDPSEAITIDYTGSVFPYSWS